MYNFSISNLKSFCILYICSTDETIYEICQHTSQQLPQTEGYIMSHTIGTSSTYPSSQTCSVTIPRESGATVEYIAVEILELSLGAKPNGVGCNDYLKLSNPDVLDTSETMVLCGEIPKYMFDGRHMNYSHLSIEFHSDSLRSPLHRGFILHYQG